MLLQVLLSFPDAVPLGIVHCQHGHPAQVLLNPEDSYILRKGAHSLDKQAALFLPCCLQRAAVCLKACRASVSDVPVQQLQPHSLDHARWVMLLASN